MKLEGAYPVVVTDHYRECRDFYVGCFGFEVVFEASWFIYMTLGSEGPISVAFMAPDHPSRPPGPEVFNGKGMFLTLQIADAAAEHKRLVAMGVVISYPLRDEPWGQRRFAVIDPAGTWVDIVQQIEPVHGFWDPYLVSAEEA
jgi:catechol 2,3-dioxygenase-like lactoylglutathione lyase family enzyme